MSRVMKARHWNQRQKRKVVLFFSSARNTAICFMAVILALVGIGVGLAEGAATTTQFGAGTTNPVSCPSGSRLSDRHVTMSSENVVCSGTPPTTTTTKPPVTTTTVPPTTTTVPPSTTTTTVPPTTTTTTQPSGGVQCVGYGGALPDPAPAGQDGYYDPTDINNSNGYNTYVNFQDTGNINTTNDKLCGSSPSSWNFNWDAADGPDGGAVQSYVAVQQLYNDWGNDSYTPLEGGPTSITSTFNTTNPSDSIGNWEMAYDLWFENYPSDVMIWENTSTARGIISSYGGATIDNPNVTIDGVSYTLIHYGSGAQPERMLVRNTNVNSGTENILADVQWLQANGYLPATDGLSQVNFGWEICDSDSQILNMAVNGYTLTRTPVQPS
jgi:hypothetical protein